MVELISYSKNEVIHTDEFKLVSDLAKKMHIFLNDSEMLVSLATANKPKASSAVIQNVFIKEAIQLGFKSEAKGLFANYENKLLRPDYFLSLGAGTGILLEVERGKTTINNMDLLDFWKCHICEHANYLFLMVPRELKQNEKNKGIRREFNTVSSRLKTFFREDNYTNVDGLFLFGY